jgi:hypothetical protein
MQMTPWMLSGLAAAACSLAVGSASAATVSWADWTSVNSTTATGAIGGVGVTVTGGLALGGRSQTGCGTNYWTQPNAGNAAYTDGIVSNGPTACEQVGLIGPTTVTVTFASAIDDLVMAIVSVGQVGVPVTYSFSQAFTLDSEGVGYWGGGQAGAYVANSSTSFTGREFHGVLRFDNPVTSLTFTVNPGEDWHAFTFGNVVPEPGSIALVLTALLAAGGLSRRRA